MTTYKASEKNRKIGIKKMALTNQIKIKPYTIDGKYQTTFESIKRATNVTGVHGSQIIACAKGKRKRAGRYV